MIISPVSFPKVTMDLLSHSDGDNSHDEAPAKKSNSAAYEMIPLEPGFEPTDLDVICARGKEGESCTACCTVNRVNVCVRSNICYLILTYVVLTYVMLCYLDSLQPSR